MPKRLMGFVPPLSRGVGYLTLFLSFAELLSQKERLHCVVPPDFPLDLFKLPSVIDLHPDYLSQSDFLSSIKIKNLEEHTLIFLENSVVNHNHLHEWDAIFVGLTASLPDVMHARKRLTELLARGFEKSRLHLFMWEKSKHFNTFKDLLQKNFEWPVHSIFNDEEAFLQAENGGMLLSESAPRSKTNRDLKNFVSQVKFESSSILDEENPAGLDQKVKQERMEQSILDRFWSDLDRDEFFTDLEEKTVRLRLARIIETCVLEHPEILTNKEFLQSLQDKLMHQILGWGPLEKWMGDPGIGEIMVNGPAEIYLEREGHMERAPARFSNESQLKIVVDRMVGGAGRRVDTASPLCDVRLSDGSRVNVVLPPVSLKGPLVTIRRFRQAFRDLDDLIQARSLTRTQADLLIQAVQKRFNIVIAGNSGSGKTTLLNILSRFINETERIVTMEDAAELQLQQPHVIRLETRKRNLEGVGEIAMSDLVINSLRMRPDRLIVGECRGPEVIPMLQAMNTGHDGSMTTLHANSAEDTIRRLESMVLLGAPQWSGEVVRRLIASGIDLIIYLKRTGSERTLESIDRLSMKDGLLEVEPYEISKKN